MTIQAIHEEAEAIIQGHPLPWDDRMSRHFENKELYESWRSENHYYLYLNALVQVVQPKQILELGTNEGGAVLFMLLALPKNGKITTIDIHPAPPDILLDIQDDRLSVVVGDDLDSMVFETLHLDPVDLLFIDTQHTKDQVTQEWEIYKRFMAPGGIVAMDDIALNHEMMVVWDKLDYPKVHTGSTYHWSGFGVFQV